EAEHMAQRDRLPRARAAEDDQHLAAVDGEVRAAQHLLRAVRLVQLAELHKRLARVRPPVGRAPRQRTAVSCDRLAHQKASRNSLVKKKSMMRTVMAPVTTVTVVARPTPSAPPVVRRPLKHPIRPTPNPKKNVLPIPDARSLYLTVSMTL